MRLLLRVADVLLGRYLSILHWAHLWVGLLLFGWLRFLRCLRLVPAVYPRFRLPGDLLRLDSLRLALEKWPGRYFALLEPRRQR